MISEYALDPKLVVQWHDPKEWAFYREAFADCTGRIASTFPRQNPKKWRQLVMRTFQEAFPNKTDQSLDWMRMDSLLELFSNRMVLRDSMAENSGSWLDKALVEHRVKPFHGILSIVPEANVAEVITPAVLFGGQPPAAWTVPPCGAVPRTSDDYARTLRPLLTRCREVFFVDPWFDPSKTRFIEPLFAMLDILWGPDRCIDSPEARLVTSERKFGVGWLMEHCSKELSHRLPQNRSLTVTILRELERGEKFHNRYVLTKFAGVSFGTGLDVAEDKETKQTDDLCRLSSDQLIMRWTQYVSARHSFFDVAGGPLTIKAQ